MTFLAHFYDFILFLQGNIYFQFGLDGVAAPGPVLKPPDRIIIELHGLVMSMFQISAIGIEVEVAPGLRGAIAGRGVDHVHELGVSAGDPAELPGLVVHEADLAGVEPGETRHQLPGQPGELLAEVGGDLDSVYRLPYTLYISRPIISPNCVLLPLVGKLRLPHRSYWTLFRQLKFPTNVKYSSPLYRTHISDLTVWVCVITI